MITIKSKREIALMKEAGKIVAGAHALIEKHIKPGISTWAIDQLIESYILSKGATCSFKGYNDFPSAICASVNEVVVHGIPSKEKILREGDIISIDIGACYKGYHGDSAWSYAVGNISAANQKLLDVTKESLFKGLAMAKPGNKLSDISHAIGSYANQFGYGVVEEFTGHGIGSKLHEDPVIPNYGPSGFGPILKPGMTLAIEPMVNIGSKRVKVLLDNWTTITVDKKNSAHFEHTILITDNGYEILTSLNEEANYV